MTDTPTEGGKPTMRTANVAATQRLREAHLDEYRQYQVEEAAKLGIDFTPQPTEQEKAEAKLVALLQENPDLKARLVDELSGKVDQPEG
jgi:hypothetical protein